MKVQTMLKLILSLFFLSTAYGLCDDVAPTIECKAGYFNFSNSKMRKIYNRGGLDLQLCASYPLCPLTPEWTLDAYGALEYFQRTGKSLHAHQKTSFWSIPVNVGLKPVYAINATMNYYCAFGPRYIYVHQHNRSTYIFKNRSKNSLGFFLNTGIHYIPCDRLIIDSFVEYSYAKIRFHSGQSSVYTHTTQIGGFTLGGGIGYTF